MMSSGTPMTYPRMGSQRIRDNTVTAAPVIIDTSSDVIAELRSLFSSSAPLYLAITALDPADRPHDRHVNRVMSVVAEPIAAKESGPTSCPRMIMSAVP